MRNDIVYHGSDELRYAIREVVEVARRIESMGVSIVWENIGDPVAKGAEVAPWVRDIVAHAVETDNSVFGYSPTRGVLETRAFIARRRNAEGGAQIGVDDILFFNGLGDAISNIYHYLNPGARVIGPDPAYPTHSSAEAAHAGSAHITYPLNPHRNWLPDLEELRNKVHYNPNVAGILIINPDNPSGFVYPRRVLEEIVNIAREHDLFIVADEIYGDLVYGDHPMTPLSQVIGQVPGIALKGLSKEIPWPGARCGWAEFYNVDSDPVFARYVRTLVDAKMLEVCSTTLPQKVLPALLSHDAYRENVRKLAAHYRRRADEAYRVFSTVSGVIAPKPGGAFYYSIVFNEEFLTDSQTLPIDNQEVAEYVRSIAQDVALDTRFIYYLLGATGICVVPMSGMNSRLYGFRMTLLEPDDARFTDTINRIAASIREYLGR